MGKKVSLLTIDKAKINLLYKLMQKSKVSKVSGPEIQACRKRIAIFFCTFVNRHNPLSNASSFGTLDLLSDKYFWLVTHQT